MQNAKNHIFDLTLYLHIHTSLPNTQIYIFFSCAKRALCRFSIQFKTFSLWFTYCEASKSVFKDKFHIQLKYKKKVKKNMWKSKVDGDWFFSNVLEWLIHTNQRQHSTQHTLLNLVSHPLSVLCILYYNRVRCSI